MSTLRTNTLSDVAGTNSPDVTRGEFCRVRYWLNGTGTIVFVDSFNCVSATDNGTGDYSIGFTNAFPNNGFSFGFGGDSGQARMITTATNNIRTNTYNTGAATNADTQHTAVIVGDKS